MPSERNDGLSVALRGRGRHTPGRLLDRRALAQRSELRTRSPLKRCDRAVEEEWGMPDPRPNNLDRKALERLRFRPCGIHQTS